MAHVFIVTHGDKFTGANPDMTAQGFAQIRSLKPHLPQHPPVVVCGTGKRHLEVAKALGLTPTRWTAVVGDATSLEWVGNQRMILLPDGTTIPREAYSTLGDLVPAMRELVVSLPDNTVICAGRPAMIALGLKEANNGAVYRVAFETHHPHRVIVGIEEIAVAGGDVGAGTREA